MIVILTQDLMMTSSVSAVARRCGHEFKSATNVERVLRLVAENPVSTLFVDLQLNGLDLSGLMAGLEAGNLKCPRIVAYAQHVNVDLLANARKSGIEHVLTRGQVHGGLEALIDPKTET